MLNGRRLACCLLILAFANDPIQAQPKGPQTWWPTQPRPLPFVHALFTNDMVLQRDVPAPIWGWSTPGDIIVIEVNGRRAGKDAVTDEQGKWLAKISPYPAGGPHTITILGEKNSVTLQNVLF